MNDVTQKLCEQLNYTFNNKELLQQALSHRSFGEKNNERLEFLGDGAVNFVVAEALYKKFPQAQEGELSRWRASLINRNTLAELGRNFNLGAYIHLGPGEIKSGGHERHSILSCAMEAVIGAIYLDGGFATCKTCILAWYEPLLQGLLDSASHKDPKTLLQEYLQARKMPLPVYHVASVAGEAHQQTFKMSCKVEGVIEPVFGHGTSRRRAEQEAALQMLIYIQNKIC